MTKYLTPTDCYARSLVQQEKLCGTNLLKAIAQGSLPVPDGLALDKYSHQYLEEYHHAYMEMENYDLFYELIDSKVKQALHSIFFNGVDGQNFTEVDDKLLMDLTNIAIRKVWLAVVTTKQLLDIQYANSICAG
ncbi:hypothetical protein [Aeromonas encheleia]|jgi:hypothetical protein